MRLASIHTYPIKGCYRLDHDGAQVEPWGLAGDRRWMIVDAEGVGVTQRETPKLVALRPTLRDGRMMLHLADLPGVDLPGAVRAAPPLELIEPTEPRYIDVRVFRSRTPVRARLAGSSADDWLSAVLDQRVRLVWLDDPTRRPTDPDYSESGDRVSFADSFPLLLASSGSLDALNGWLAETGTEPLPMTRFRPNVVVDGATAWAEDDWVGRRIRVGELVFRVVKPCGRCVVTTTDQETGGRGREPLRMLAKHRTVDQRMLFGVYLIPDAPGALRVGDPVELLPG